MSDRTLWAAVTLALLVVGVAPAVYLGARGSNVERLIGLQLLSVSGSLVLVGLSAIVNQTSYLIVPLVLAVLGATGTLVYTRLLTPRIDGQEDER